MILECISHNICVYSIPNYQLLICRCLKIAGDFRTIFKYIKPLQEILGLTYPTFQAFGFLLGLK